MRSPTTRTAPTAGFGLVWPTDFRASASALRMKRSSLFILHQQYSVAEGPSKSLGEMSRRNYAANLSQLFLTKLRSNVSQCHVVRQPRERYANHNSSGLSSLRNVTLGVLIWYGVSLNSVRTIFQPNEKGKNL